MKNKEKPYNIKLPSGDAVTVKNLFDISKIIAQTGKSFSEEHILAKDSPINKNSLFRVLAYLKYIGLIFETREIQRINGEDKKIQKWHQKDSSKIVDFFYALKAGREATAKEKFVEIIESHDLFLGIREELMKGNPSPTKLDLENYFKKKNPMKSPNYYQRGVRFFLSLLTFCNLIKKEGDTFRLIQQEKSKEENAEEENVETEPEESFIGEHKFIAHVYGKDTNFKIPLNDVSDIEDLEVMLKIIRKKLI